MTEGRAGPLYSHISESCYRCLYPCYILISFSCGIWSIVVFWTMWLVLKSMEDQILSVNRIISLCYVRVFESGKISHMLLLVLGRSFCNLYHLNRIQPSLQGCLTIHFIIYGNYWTVQALCREFFKWSKLMNEMCLLDGIFAEVFLDLRIILVKKMRTLHLYVFYIYIEFKSLNETRYWLTWHLYWSLSWNDVYLLYCIGKLWWDW